MFIDLLQAKNKKLLECAFLLHQNQKIAPDSYVIDVDAIRHNVGVISKEANKYDLKVWGMLKQLGRNPILAKIFENQGVNNKGFDGFVAVDSNEANILAKHGLKLSHLGHLVQTPKIHLRNLMAYGVEFITVYSLEYASLVSAIAVSLNIQQKVILKPLGSEDKIYDGQWSGVLLENFVDFAKSVSAMPNLMVKGLTAFPCFLFDESSGAIKPTPNLYSVLKAEEIIKKNTSISLEHINLPSANTSSMFKVIKDFGGTVVEPGHSVSGSTPLHAVDFSQDEIPAYVYVSEVSHNFLGDSLGYGGGTYSRGHMKHALVGSSLETSLRAEVEELSASSIDYYFKLKGEYPVFSTILSGFRTQIFITRSSVVLVEGIMSGNPKIIGIFDSQGNKID